VHRGKLASGQIVAIKIQRPDIENIIAIDFKAIRKVINMIKIFTDWEKFVDLDAIYHEFYETILAELDYIKEGKNAETIAANCADDPAIIIPAIIWEYTRTRVLTMEYMEGIKISDHQALEAAGINRAALAEKLLQTYIKQVLIHGFYHADPHPGNLFVDQEGHLIMLDFAWWGLSRWLSGTYCWKWSMPW
jgi:predicted unusual protein kinase regulating ubiquinone biosynthesis (AarF/ABC1/UbiB family)